MNKGKKWLLFTIVLLLTTTLAATVVASRGIVATAPENISDYELGSAIRLMGEEPDQERIVAIIGEQEINQRLVEFQKFSLALQNKSNDENEIIKAIAFRTVAVQEAKERKLYPSREEALVYVDMIRGMFDAHRDTDLSAELPEEMSDYIDGLGLSEDAYWEDEATIDAYRNGLAIAKLREALGAEWATTNSGLIEPQASFEFEEKYNNYINQRVNEVEIVILDQSIFQ